MKIDDTFIEDTFAEAFSMKYTKFVISADDRHWLDAAINECCGYGSSVIACDAEIGVSQYPESVESIDGRIACEIMAFGFAFESLGKAIANRIGQSVMTCASTAVFDGLAEGEERLPLGKQLRFFGDGFQKSKLIDGRRFWRIPVMDGEFVVEESLGASRGIAGGNFLIQSVDRASGLNAAKLAVQAINQIPDVMMPFPGGVVRSGSKVGSRYNKLKASTSDAFCPTLVGRTETKVVAGANCVYEIVIDGADFDSIAKAMAVGIRAACIDGVPAIHAGNYGGKLGKHHFHLREVMEA